MITFNWTNAQDVGALGYTCGYCGHRVGPNRGYYGRSPEGYEARIYICPHCSKASFFDNERRQTPAVRMGRDVKGITEQGVGRLYAEARDCTGVGAYTGAVLLCRKILMNIAVQHGAPANQPFATYVDFLAASGFVPLNGKTWVDKIRDKGNEATHDIPAMTAADAEQILNFTEMLLRFVYEFQSL